jgi:hypothetical protein
VTTIVCDLDATDAGATLIDALSTQGCAALVGHGVPDAVVEDMRPVPVELRPAWEAYHAAMFAQFR